MIRARNGQLRFLDDFCLFFACVCLITATVLLNLGADNLYQISVYRNMVNLVDEVSSKQVIDGSVKIQNFIYPYGCVSWATIFFVKYSYLAFFHAIIDRQHSMIVYWRCICIFTFFAGVFNITSAFIGCPEFGTKSLKCTNHYYLKRLLATQCVTIIFDIVTDLLILSLPIYMLYKVKIKTKQKLGVGSFLCLSVFMIIIAIIRISKINAADFEVWACFWQHFEGCIAVLMVSLTAFRTMFVGKHSSASDQRKPKFSDTYRRRLWFSKKSSENGNEKAHVSVPIPGATLTGLRTLVRGGTGVESLSTDDSLDRPAGAKKPHRGGQDGVHVTHDFDERSSQADHVRPQFFFTSPHDF